MAKDPIKRIRHHTFYGRKYKFTYADPTTVVSTEEIADVKKRCGLDDTDEIVGLTSDNRAEKLTMIVSDKLEKENPKDLLRVLLDEAIHACDFTIDNAVVAEYATDLSDFLWRCGYRRVTSSGSCSENKGSVE